DWRARYAVEPGEPRLVASPRGLGFPNVEVTFLIARIGLAAIFAVAAVAKLADRSGARATLVEFGLPPNLAGLGAIALPVLELTIAVLLFPTLTARWGALAAAATF